jgi:hypothetical protein
MAPDRLKPRRIRDLMVMTGYCALYLALFRLTRGNLFYFTIGPLCGAAIHRLLGASGIKGGIIVVASTFASWVGFACVAHAHSGFDAIEQVCIITLMAVGGGLAGFAIGVLMWAAARWLVSWHRGQSNSDVRGV